MIRAGLIACVAVLAACGPSGDPLQITLRLSQGPEQACAATDCNDVPMSCDSIVLLRVIDPDDPEMVYVDECVTIPNDGPPSTRNVCQLNSAGFILADRLPTKRVEVQLAVYPRSALQVGNGADFVCPSQVAFTGTGFAAPTNTPQPALAGVGYVDGYASEVIIELGCNDTVLIDTAECRNLNAIDISASVIDFDTSVSVGENQAHDMTIRVGEPKVQDVEWIFDPASTVELPLVEPGGPEPSWHADDLNLDLVQFACVQVLGEAARSTASLTCRELPDTIPPALDLGGVLVKDAVVTQVLDALALIDFPTQGLVIGAVVDFTGSPVSGAVVDNDAGGSVQYLSSNLSTVGGTMTTSSGVFVSTTATFDNDGGANRWHATALPLVQKNSPIGGLVKNRLTVIVIQLDLDTM